MTLYNDDNDDDNDDALRPACVAGRGIDFVNAPKGVIIVVIIVIIV